MTTLKYSLSKSLLACSYALSHQKDSSHQQLFRNWEIRFSISHPLKRSYAPDNVRVVGFAKLFEEGDLAKDRHGHPILSQGKLHLDRRSRLLPDSVTVKVVQHELTMIQNCEMRLRIKNVTFLMATMVSLRVSLAL